LKYKKFKIEDAVGAESVASQKVFNDLFNTVHRIVVDAKVGGAGVSKTVLVGGGALLPNVTEIAKNILGHEVLLGNPFRTIVPPAEVVAPVLSAVGPEFAVSVGLALRGLEEF
jgi:Tfp pilus assembly PilM family ATPase